MKLKHSSNQFPVGGFEVLLEAESFIQILHRTPLYTMGTVRLLGAMLTGPLLLFLGQGW